MAGGLIRPICFYANHQRRLNHAEEEKKVFLSYLWKIELNTIFLPLPIMQSKTIPNTRICIVGAGPGGCATALKLSYMGIPCTLIDKAVFPRDKVCGDALSGKVTTLLNRLDPAILERFNDQVSQSDVWGLMFVPPNEQALTIPFKRGYIRDKRKAPGYLCKRIHFDNFLIEEVKRRDRITLLEGVSISDYQKVEQGWRLVDKTGEHSFLANILIVADGAHSKFARKVAGLEKINKHYAASVRAYFSGVTGMNVDNYIELHFLKSITPGYLWIFPMPNGEANVGLYMRSDMVSKKRINLKALFEQTIQKNPAIQERLKAAKMIGRLEGYGLPLGSKLRKISGDNYMLVGDAGHLIDPLTGEGIGHAFYSGFIAAEQAAECIEAEQYDAAYMNAYDVRVKRVLGMEMKLSHQLQNLMKPQYVPLVNFFASILSGNKKFIDILSRMYNDLEYRKQLVNPLFWIRSGITASCTKLLAVIPFLKGFIKKR